MSAEEHRLVLEVIGSAKAPVELPRSGVLTIGSSTTRADLVVEGQGVADVHCAIGRIKGGGWALKDLGSPAGTIVNGNRAQSVRLEAGDVVTLGTRKLRVVDPATASAPTTFENAKSATADAGSAAARAMATTLVVPRNGGTAPVTPRVSGYRIEGLLGRGGMGQVFIAVQESLDRRVALKMLSDRLAADLDFVRRFQAEARAAAALNHPNVVTVHDVWEDSGRHFLSMEYMDKGTLESRVARAGKLPWSEALEVMHDAAKGLVYAELRGIVHRDIKPANLMQNSVGTTKIADLGLATHLEAEATESDNKKIYGTPHFISPEQARGERVDARSDLYSLGATAYRLLSGHTPFEGATTRDILRGHFFEEPRPLAELVRDVPAELARIVHKLLRKRPDERYGSAGALLQELDRLRSESVHGIGAAPAAAPRSRKGTLLALVGLAAAAAIGVFVWRGRESAHATSPSRGAAPVAADDPRPSDVAHPAPAASTSSGPEDDDSELERLEEKAELAYLRLPKDLTPDEKRAKLAELQEQYAGTTQATRFQAEAVEIERAMHEQQRAALDRGRESSQWLARLRDAASSGAAAQSLGPALDAMLKVQIDPQVLGDPGFQAQRLALVRETVHAAVERLRAGLAEAAALEESGDFPALEKRLKEIFATLELPDLPPEFSTAAVPELVELNEARATLHERLLTLPAAKNRFYAKTRNADAEALAKGLGGKEGVEDDLRVLDLEAADARLAKLEGEVRTESSKRFVRELREGVASGKRALETLGREFEKGTWRRKTIMDPRSKNGALREAVGASPRGLRLKVDSAIEEVPWSAFGGKTAELHQLFHQRLAREYTREELLGIETLLRTSAVLQAINEADEMLAPQSGANLTDEEARAMLEGFTHARGWADAAGSLPRLEHERAAVEVLAVALRANAASSWSKSVANFERLLGEFADTLIVRMLSDGHTPIFESERSASPPTSGAVQPPNSGGKPANAPGGSSGEPTDDGGRRSGRRG